MRTPKYTYPSPAEELESFVEEHARHRVIADTADSLRCATCMRVLNVPNRRAHAVLRDRFAR